jgi:hypothetical protein
MDLLVPLTREIAAALGEFWQLAAVWKLTEAEESRLLQAPGSSYAQWKNGRATMVCGLDMFRLDNLLSLHAKWAREHGSNDRVGQWLRQPNLQTPFSGKAPLEYLVGARTTSLGMLLSDINTQFHGAPGAATSTESDRQGLHQLN